MHLSATSRPTRVRRLLAVSAAAVAVMIAPTACDYGGYGGGSAAHDMGDMGDMPGMDHGARTPDQQPVVVPVGNIVTTTPEASADGAATTAAAAEARRSGRDERRDRDDRRRWRNRPAGQPAPTTATIPAPAPGGDPATGTDTATATATDTATVAPTASVDPTATVAPTATATAPVTAPPANVPLEVLGRDCTASQLAPHTGFQSADPQCVSTAMGEVAAENQLPSLLITKSPETVGVNQPFTLEISTRNLVRDRFLGAAAGGYYLESSFLNGEGLQRGHFHTACRILPSSNEAPDSGKAPEFFLATQDNGGGRAPDKVTIEVPGIKSAGELQCTSWAGDGSHRTPMMSRANETPAIDSVRITVTGSAPAAVYDPAAAQQDAAAQAEAQQQEAVEQAPDQDGAPQPGADAGLPTATSTATSAEVPAADTASSSASATEAPAGN
jgi:hypothetical protein